VHPVRDVATGSIPCIAFVHQCHDVRRNQNSTLLPRLTCSPRDDIAALQAAVIVERERAARVEAELAVTKAKASDDQALIAH
jgi:hypothetical protein